MRGRTDRADRTLRTRPLRGPYGGLSRLRGRLKHFKAHSEAISVWSIFFAARKVQVTAIELTECLQCRAVSHLKQLPRHVNPEIRVDAYELRVKCGVMNLGKRDTIANDWLPVLLICVLHDVRRIQ
jgi:hypothetical protein